MNVGLAAGRYSGTSRPDLYLTPQALHSVFGPIGPVRHCGVFSDAQCVHFRPLDDGEYVSFSLVLLVLAVVKGRNLLSDSVEDDEVQL